MPGRDLRRKARYIALRMMATMIEPRCLIGWDGALPLFQAVVVEEGKWFLRNWNRIDRRNPSRNRWRAGHWKWPAWDGCILGGPQVPPGFAFAAAVLVPIDRMRPVNIVAALSGQKFSGRQIPRAPLPSWTRAAAILVLAGDNRLIGRHDGAYSRDDGKTGRARLDDSSPDDGSGLSARGDVLRGWEK